MEILFFANFVPLSNAKLRLGSTLIIILQLPFLHSYN